MQKVNFRLTLAQITYLETIRRLQQEQKKCTVSRVASLSGVTHAPVSRFLKFCQEQKLVDENNYLTDAGSIFLQEQQQLVQETTRLVQELGFTGEAQKQGVRNLMEDVEPGLLRRLLEREQRRRELDLLCESGRNRETIPAKMVEELISYGTHAVEFRLLRIRGEEGLSMADHGFEHPAYVHKDESGVWLELHPRKMLERSGKNGHMMTGQLETLRYENQGVLMAARAREEGLHIPLEVFTFVREDKTAFTGTLYVTVTCTVGNEHMPENTAQLIVWL